jgi:type I restriction enzyme S subunit
MIGTIGEIARVKKSDLPFYGQNMYLVRFDQKQIDINYFLHYFDSELMKDYFQSVKNNSAQGYLKAEHIEEIQIPLPALTKQKEIAGILNTYSALINDIAIGLPAELEARRQQYEYYRNELLTFKELDVA